MTQQSENCKVYGGEGRKEACQTYTIQVGLDVAVGIDRGLLAAQLVDAADDRDIAAYVAVEEGRGNAWGGCRVHGVRREKREGRKGVLFRRLALNTDTRDGAEIGMDFARTDGGMFCLG